MRCHALHLSLVFFEQVESEENEPASSQYAHPTQEYRVGAIGTTVLLDGPQKELHAIV